MRYYSLQRKYQFFPGGFTPRPPYLSFRFTFNRPGDTNIKSFVGLFTQTPHLSFLFTSNRPRDTSHYSTNIKHFPGGGGFTPRPPYLSFLFTFNKLWDTRHYSTNIRDLPPEQFNLRERVLQVAQAQVQKIIIVQEVQNCIYWCAKV